MKIHEYRIEEAQTLRFYVRAGHHVQSDDLKVTILSISSKESLFPSDNSAYEVDHC